MGCGRGRSLYPYGIPNREDYPRSNYPNTNYQTEKKPESAVDILKKRLANGEITPDQYAEMLEVITGSKASSANNAQKSRSESQERPIEKPVKPVVKPIKTRETEQTQKPKKPVISLRKKK